MLVVVRPDWWSWFDQIDGLSVIYQLDQINGRGVIGQCHLIDGYVIGQYRMIADGSVMRQHYQLIVAVYPPVPLE